MHGLLFMASVRDRNGERAASASSMAEPLTVHLASREAPVAAMPSSAEPTMAPEPKPRRERILAAREPTVAPTPRAVEPTPPPQPLPVPAPQAPFDMAALILANRERRRLAEAAAVRGAGREPSAAHGAEANLSRNLRTLARSDGTGGVFQIRRMGAQTAEFAFNGWSRARPGQWRELIEVQAGPDGDLERAVVRRMIALIREHYTGDFTWESHRLGRVLVLSAAPEDNEGLEEVLLREFFERRP